MSIRNHSLRAKCRVWLRRNNLCIGTWVVTGREMHTTWTTGADRLLKVKYVMKKREY